MISWSLESIITIKFAANVTFNSVAAAATLPGVVYLDFELGFTVATSIVASGTPIVSGPLGSIKASSGACFCCAPGTFGRPKNFPFAATFVSKESKDSRDRPPEWSYANVDIDRLEISAGNHSIMGARGLHAFWA